MSQSFSIPYVKTTPAPFGVNVEWKWPEGAFWYSWLELQYLLNDGRLVTESIRWPVTTNLISGLKAGERLQVRLRPFGEDGSTPDWTLGDWVEGVSLTDASEIVDALQQEISVAEPLSNLAAKAFIGNGRVSANYSVKLNINNDDKKHAAGMNVGIEGGESKVFFQADRFKVHENAKAIIENAVASMTSKAVLSDEMKLAVIDAVRESDLFTSLQDDLKQMTHDAVSEVIKDVIRNALKPGGVIWAQMEPKDATAN